MKSTKTKSTIQSYGKQTIFLLSAMFLVCCALSLLQVATPEKAAMIWSGYAQLITGSGVIIGLTIIRKGARETAANLSGGYKTDNDNTGE